MPHHVWGDEWFEKNGADLDRAISYCCGIWRKYGRIGTHGKEKYGTFRDQLMSYRAEWPIHELVKPGYVMYRWPRQFMRLERKLGTVVRFLRLHKPIQWYQRQVYNYAVQKACKKYPKIIDEIVSDLDGYEWVKPGAFGPIDGVKIHSKYWKEMTGE